MSTTTAVVLPRHTTLSKVQFGLVSVIFVVLFIATSMMQLLPASGSDPMLRPTLWIVTAVASLGYLVWLCMFLREPRKIQKRYIELMTPREIPTSNVVALRPQ